MRRVHQVLAVGVCYFAAGCAVQFGASTIADGGSVEGGGPVTCGNGQLDTGEECEGSDLGGASCLTLGYFQGTLSCGQSCYFDVSSCRSTGCGDGACQIDLGETTGTCPQDCAWKTVSCSRLHTCGVKNDGKLFCWGKGDKGQLGNGELMDELIPRQVSDELLVRAIEVSASGTTTADGTQMAHTCAVSVDGEVYCWGSNDFGQLGDGTISLRPEPVAAARIAGAKGVAAGGYHTCAWTDQAELFCWGGNRWGQLGVGDTVDSTAPRQILFSETDGSVTTITCEGHCCTAMDQTHYGFCWGLNDNGHLGDGTTTDRSEPTLVSGGYEWLAVQTGGDHTCGILVSGEVMCWGSGNHGQLGNNEITDQVLEPESVLTGLSGASDLACGSDHCCALFSGGQAYCWGANASGQLGNGNNTEYAVPVPVSGNNVYVSLDSQGSTTCGVRVDGSAWCWGSNSVGQLGTGTTTSSNVPLKVVDPYDP